MQVAAKDYRNQIDKVNQELTQAFTLLKRRKKMQHKQVKMLQKRIKHLYETLTDLKYRATINGTSPTSLPEFTHLRSR